MQERLKSGTLLKKINHCIVSFDSDFLDLNTLYGSPPKSYLAENWQYDYRHLAKLILDRKIIIQNFLEDTDAEILQILGEQNEF